MNRELYEQIDTIEEAVVELHYKIDSIMDKLEIPLEEESEENGEDRKSRIKARKQDE